MSDRVSAAGPLTTRIFQYLLTELPADARLLEAVVGLHWTAVAVEVNGRRQCGLASTILGEHAHGERQNVRWAGDIQTHSVHDLANLIWSDSPTERSLGLATINACMNRTRSFQKRINAGSLLADKAAGHQAALIGHFPFIEEIRESAQELFVFELEPSPGEYPPERAEDLLPQCQAVGITSMTLLNRSLAGLMDHISANAFVLLIGPSTPLSEGMFQFGIDALAGTVVQRIPPVLRAIRQGANYRQIHRIGTDLVILEPG
ncbi:MAG: Rossmann-like domain-containing protein [Anaerolineales bacterium]